MRKRGKDHTWQIVKYKDDISLYAKCKCGYKYSCSENKRSADVTISFEQEVKFLFNYCPVCGARKKWMTDIVKTGEYLYSDEAYCRFGQNGAKTIVITCIYKLSEGRTSRIQVNLKGNEQEG